MDLNNIISNLTKYNILHIVVPTSIPVKILLTNELLNRKIKTYTALSTIEECQSMAQYQILAYDKYSNLISTMDKKTNNNLLIYGTSDMIKRLILAYFKNGQIISNITFCDVLIIDSYDSGSLENTLILSLWQLALQFGAKIPKLVLISNVSLDIVESRFMLTLKNPTTSNIEYLQDDVLINTNQWKKEINNKIIDIITNIFKLNKLKSSIVIFVANEKDIEILSKLLKNTFRHNSNIISVYNATDFIINKPHTILKNIVITNNVFELLNLLDIGYVIDTMLEQKLELNNSKSFRYGTNYISKDVATKRSNLIKNTNGICYRLCTKKSYDTFEPKNTFEIDRIPIYKTIIEMFNVGLSPGKVLIYKNSDNIINSIQDLINLDIITNDFMITEIAVFIYSLPLSNKLSIFLWHWIQQKLPIFVGIVISCIIDCYGPPYIYISSNSDITELKSKNPYILNSQNDLEICLNIWNNLMDTIQGLDYKTEIVVKWCTTNSMNNIKITELLSFVKNCYNVLSPTNDIEISSFDPKIASEKTIPIISKIFDDMELHNTSGNNYSNKDDTQKYFIDKFNFYNILPKNLLVLVSKQNKIIFSIPISPQNSSQDSSQNSSQDSSQNSSQNSSQDSIQNSSKDLSKDSYNLNDAILLIDSIRIDNIFEIIQSPKSSLDELINTLEI
jgi:galactitol-specific phosphotransferase system IIB component